MDTTGHTQMKTGIILANTGTPASPEPDAIEAYLKQFLMDPRILQMPRPVRHYLVYRHIVPKRKFSSSEKYRAIWRKKGSPLVLDQRLLAEKVQGLFNTQSDSVSVRIGMSYGSPSIKSVLEQFKAEGYERIVLLPLYPQSAFSPTQAVIDSFKQSLSEIEWEPETIVVDNYHDNQHYIQGIAEALKCAGYGQQEDDEIFFSMHSILLKDIDAGDTYVAQTKRSVELIASELGIPSDDITVGFQSVFGHRPEKWQGPLSLDILNEMRIVGGTNRIFFMCPGFSIDCLETLYDIPFEMCPALEGEGVLPDQAKRFIWVRCLGPSDEHARIIKDVLDAALKG